MQPSLLPTELGDEKQALYCNLLPLQMPRSIRICKMFLRLVGILCWPLGFPPETGLTTVAFLVLFRLPTSNRR